MTKKYELLPIEVSVVGFLCSLCWFTYSFLDNNNTKIMIPNGLGILFSIIQIITWIYYYTLAQKNSPQLQQFLEPGSSDSEKNAEKI